MSRKYKLAISVLAIVLNALTAAFAYSFVGHLDLAYGVRFLIGWLIMVSPVFTFFVVCALWRKEKTDRTEQPKETGREAIE